MNRFVRHVQLLMNCVQSFHGGNSLGENASCKQPPNHNAQKNNDANSQLNNLTHEIDAETVVEEPHLVSNRTTIRRNKQTTVFISDEVIQRCDDILT